MVHMLWSNAHNFQRLYESIDREARVKVFRRVKKRFSVLVFAILIASASPTQSAEQDMWLYEQYLYDSWYDVVDREWFWEFLDMFQPLLEYLDGFILTGEDINNAMNLYSSWKLKEQAPREFMDFYNYFLHSYPNPDIDIAQKLSEIGIVAIPLMAELQQS